MVKPSRRKEMAQQARTEFTASIRLVCEIFSISETCYRYEAILSDENAEIYEHSLMPRFKDYDYNTTQYECIENVSHWIPVDAQEYAGNG